jgi:hypothetical protein
VSGFIFIALIGLVWLARVPRREGAGDAGAAASAAH